jgi:TPR repeat protein
MKNIPSLAGALAILTVVGPLAAHAQVNVGIVRRSLDKATGGASSAQNKALAGQAPGADQAPVVVNPQAAIQSEKDRQAAIAAADAAANRRNKAALVGADQRVIEFLRKRIADGSADAAFDLAKRHEEGKGVPEDAVEARRLYSLAAERGNEDAKTWLTEHPAPKITPADAKKEVAAPKKPEAEQKKAEK